MAEKIVVFKPRDYQRELIEWFQPVGSGQGKGMKRAFAVWHRRAGKDRVATWIESMLAMNRVGLYWHALPEYAQARRVIWDAITKDGHRLIDINFPPWMVKKKHEHEMKLELINGSIWQPVGADNFNSLVGSNPVHVTYSEYALMAPAAREYLRPIIAENNGSELFITTPRGYNHAHDLYMSSKDSPLWFCSVKTVDDTRVLSREVLEEEKRTMPDELFRQEFYCDFSAANVGAILGRWIEQCEKDNRVNDLVEYDPNGQGIVISSDIGRHDTSAWWFWQASADGFALVDYDEDSGMDAEEWCERLKKKLDGRVLDKIWLPHDAKAKTFAAKHSAIEIFLLAFGSEVMRVVPLTSKADRINAARKIAPFCHFNKFYCAKGLAALRAWAFEWNSDTKQFGRDPKHDWASHSSDSFSYGAQIMQKYIPKDKKERILQDIEGNSSGMITLPCLETLWKESPTKVQRY